MPIKPPFRANPSYKAPLVRRTARRRPPADDAGSAPDLRGRRRRELRLSRRIRRCDVGPESRLPVGQPVVADLRQGRQRSARRSVRRNAFWQTSAATAPTSTAATSSSSTTISPIAGWRRSSRPRSRARARTTSAWRCRLRRSARHLLRVRLRLRQRPERLSEVGARGRTRTTCTFRNFAGAARSAAWPSGRSTATRSSPATRRDHHRGSTSARSIRTWTACSPANLRRHRTSSGRPGGADVTILGIGSPGLDGVADGVQVFQFHPDFVTPGNSTFTGRSRRRRRLHFTSTCRSSSRRRRPLEDLPWVMYKADYRNFGDPSRLVVSSRRPTPDGGVVGRELVRAADPRRTPTSSSRARTRRTRRTAGLPELAQDVSGDIAVGFSVADDDPSSRRSAIRAASRAIRPVSVPGRGDSSPATVSRSGLPLGRLQHDRPSIRSTSARSGTRPCTCPAAGGFDWATRIGSFKFSELHGRPDGHARGHRHRRNQPDRRRQGPGGTASTSTTDASGALLGSRFRSAPTT